MRKTLCLLICMVMLFTLLPTSAFATEGQEIEGDVWDGSITQPTTLVQKDGVYYYEITKCSELAYVAQTGGDWLTYNYILGNNLILNDVELTWDVDGNLTNTETLLKWTPIEGYTGKFDGTNYIITGLYVNQPQTDRIGLFSLLSENAFIRNVQIQNSYLIGKNYVGAIAGDSYNSGIDNCSFQGRVKGKSFIGGIIGNGHAASNCINSGTIIGENEVGGICGCGSVSSFNAVNKQFEGCINYGDIHGDTAGGIVGVGIAASYSCCKNCDNYGAVSGKVCGGIAGSTDCMAFNKIRFTLCNNFGEITASETAGGICGISAGFSECINTAAVHGKKNSGGIVGEYHSNEESGILQCANLGTIMGEENVGGICGSKASGANKISISDCYNAGNVEGISFLGGILGINHYCNVINCYSIGTIFGTNNVGSIAGECDHIWGESKISNCYYLKDDTHNPDIEPFGNISGDSIGAAEALSNAEMKQQFSFTNWDFDRIWTIDPTNNNGYPYLQWQENILSDIPVNGTSISNTTLDMSQGDYYYLTATVSPTTASNSSITWSSSNSTIATVTAAGKVTAIAPGTATITATTVDGGYTAICTVTVTARQAMEYQINSITVREADGTPLQTIPASNFLTTVSVTKLTEAGNSMIFLASYTAAGQFKGLMYVSVEDLPVGATIKVTLPVDNSKNDIAELKAFAIPSFSNLQPIGNAVTFPAEPQ